MASSKAGGTASLALAVCAALLLVGCAGTGAARTDEDCAEQKQKTVKLKIKLKDGVPTKVEKDGGADGETISVCPGDYVVWGADGAEFRLQFKDTAAGKVPFNWVEGKKKSARVAKDKWELIEVVREDVDRNVGLKYDVVTLDGVHDPLIIVER